MGKLADFLSPFPVGDTLTRQSRERLDIVTGKCTHTGVAGFTWDALIRMACTIDDPGEVRITSNRKDIPSLFLWQDDAIDAAKLDRLTARGASIVINNAHRFDTGLGAIVRDFIDLGGTAAWLGAVGTAGPIGALPRHADEYDLFIVQIEGAKRWRIYDREDGADDPVHEITLAGGEYLYLPRGSIHECDTLTERSLHLGLGFAGTRYDVWGDAAPVA